jgi:hypothetical protein
VTSSEQWPTPEQVLEALDSAGHLLEQQVATQLSHLGFNVATNRAFTDIDEGKSREVDVWAYKELLRLVDRRLRVAVYLLVECKNTAAPLAFLTRPITEPRGRPEEFVFTRHTHEREFTDAGKTYQQHTSTFDVLGLREKYWGTSDFVKAVHVSRLDRKGGSWSAVNTGVFDSMTWPMAKAVRAFKRPWRNENRGFNAGTDWSHVLLFVPVVVVASKLFVADGTSPEPVVREQQSVRFQREFKAKNFEGVFGIDFVQRDALSWFVTDVVDAFCNDLVQVIRADPDAVIPPDKWAMAEW